MANKNRKKWKLRGEGAIDAGMQMLFIALFTIVTITILPIFMAQVGLNQYCDELVRQIEVVGDIHDPAVATRMNELRSTTLKVDPDDVSFDGTQYWISYTDGRIQLNDRIVVSASYLYEVQLGTIWDLNITLKASSDGLSEVYFK